MNTVLSRTDAGHGAEAVNGPIAFGNSYRNSYPDTGQPVWTQNLSVPRQDVVTGSQSFKGNMLSAPASNFATASCSHMAKDSPTSLEIRQGDIAFATQSAPNQSSSSAPVAGHILDPATGLMSRSTELHSTIPSLLEQSQPQFNLHYYHDSGAADRSLGPVQWNSLLGHVVTASPQLSARPEPVHVQSRPGLDMGTAFGALEGRFFPGLASNSTPATTATSGLASYPASSMAQDSARLFDGGAKLDRLAEPFYIPQQPPSYASMPPLYQSPPVPRPRVIQATCVPEYVEVAPGEYVEVLRPVPASGIVQQSDGSLVQVMRIHPGAARLGTDYSSMKTDGKVKRPQNSFLLFSNEFRAKLRQENSHLTNAQVSKLLGERWKALTEQQRMRYSNTAARIKRDFTIAHPDFVYTKSAKKMKKAKKQDASEEHKAGSEGTGAEKDGAPGPGPVGESCKVAVPTGSTSVEDDTDGESDGSPSTASSDDGLDAEVQAAFSDRRCSESSPPSNMMVQAEDTGQSPDRVLATHRTSADFADGTTTRCGSATVLQCAPSMAVTVDVDMEQHVGPAVVTPPGLSASAMSSQQVQEFLRSPAGTSMTSRHYPPQQQTLNLDTLMSSGPPPATDPYGESYTMRLRQSEGGPETPGGFFLSSMPLADMRTAFRSMFRTENRVMYPPS